MVGRDGMFAIHSGDGEGTVAEVYAVVEADQKGIGIPEKNSCENRLTRGIHTLVTVFQRLRHFLQTISKDASEAQRDKTYVST
jgi:hypothetical protein